MKEANVSTSPRLPQHVSDGTSDEERKGLLSGDVQDRPDPELSGKRPWTKRILVLATAAALLLLGVAAGECLLSRRADKNTLRATFLKDAVRSNGTHDFKPTVLVVSIDGLQAGYLDRGLTPHLLDIAKKGLRAKFMKPIFPTLTFPNHWALMTGLYAESHGIVANNFWDPETGTEFHYNSAAHSWNASWWFGEPMWETAGKAGLITANLMWPGPPQTRTGWSPTYFIPWRDKVPLKEKHDQIMAWLDMPIDTRPQLIMAYEPSLDQAGHLTGPNSTLVNNTLSYVDRFAKDIHESLEARNLTDIVDVVFVSDHGMTDTSHLNMIYIDEILGKDGYEAIEHEDGWPSMGIRFSPSVDAAHYLDILLDAARANPEKFDVYTHETMPQRYHFSDNPRIAPIYIVPKMAYALTTRKDGDVGFTKGNHGYDNDEPSMRAFFVAHGPFSAVTKVVQKQNSQRLMRRLLGNPNEGWHSTADDTYVLEGFENVNLYNLVMKLLGIQDSAAKTNGTEGFWDKYF
ncbi:Phosphodiest-domain-containing protein [Gloeophyllum trabeum ATCC 11539]|uniref:Phosphodiest-domain-containing protein n=1 Tax=Gloeophyllum trabeum (strain ATCC 11539 / FP-39264 / Madison 617) TaxID=670483 RepID=S7RJM8_GLOTA|nr:Phosphodiest-domain-containing protein [Gloeophyllum trabeum ATCC 11539]EPQ54545.1 Phosphodiest-domain-containing protein [Gloeophyllum trabeum ATCC 11539]